MIDPNLGTTERFIRAAIGLFLALYIWSQPEFGPLEWIGMVCSVFLMLNAITSRCYLWKWLGIDSCDDGLNDCRGKGASS